MFAVVLIASNTIGALPLLIAIGIKSVSNPEVFSQLAANPNDFSVLGLDPNTVLDYDAFPFYCRIGSFYSSC